MLTPFQLVELRILVFQAFADVKAEINPAGRAAGNIGYRQATINEASPKWAGQCAATGNSDFIYEYAKNLYLRS